jgi:hypothetical protein
VVSRHSDCCRRSGLFWLARVARLPRRWIVSAAIPAGSAAARANASRPARARPAGSSQPLPTPSNPNAPGAAPGDLAIPNPCSSANVSCANPGPGNPNAQSPEQQALKDIVNDATNGGRKHSAPTMQIRCWAGQTKYNYPGARAAPGDVGNPSNWDGSGNVPHIHLPGVGSGHVPVGPGVTPR